MAVVGYGALATGALGFTMALAWNDAISKTVHSIAEPLVGVEKASHREAVTSVLVAIVVTLLVALLVYLYNSSVEHFNLSPAIIGGSASAVVGKQATKIAPTLGRR